MTLNEFYTISNRIDREMRYYNETSVYDTDEKYIDERSYWNALYKQKENWKDKILEKAVKSLDKNYFYEV